MKLSRVSMLSILFLPLLSLGVHFEERETPKTGISSDPVTFTADKEHSNLGFRVRHLGIANVNGAFQDYETTVFFEPGDLTTLRAEAIIKVGSINTGISRRDNHLRSDDFFHAEKYPEIRFVSKAVQDIRGPAFKMVGDLTIRDVTHEVVLDAQFFGVGQVGETRKAGFEAQTTINRFDYNLKWDHLTEAGGLIVSDRVQIRLDLELSEAGD